MQQTNFDHISRYEEIFIKLSKILNEFLARTPGKSIKGFNLKQKQLDENGYENNLIENDFHPDELVQEIKSSYLSRDYLEGEIGTIDGQDQYDGIFNIALYMLMSNRLGKLYKRKIEKSDNIDENHLNAYLKKYKNLMAEKTIAISELIYSLYIYRETENDNDFFYGISVDNYGDNRFVIDLPVYGQISVHFGSDNNFESIKYLARENIDLILDKKLELGQITNEQYNELHQKASTDELIPEYTGKLYEYSSSIPLDYCGEKFEIAEKDLKLSGKMISEITDDDIKNISENRKYNSRELYYFALKSDFSKSQLEQLSIYLQERDSSLNQHHHKDKISSIDINTIGKKAIELTTAEERSEVSKHENLSNNIINKSPDNIVDESKEK